MFNQLMESGTGKEPTKKGWAVAGSMIAQSLCVITLVLIPLIYTQALPNILFNTALIEPVPSAAPLTSTEPSHARVRKQPSMIIANGIMHEPRAVPPKVETFVEQVPPDLSVGTGADANASGVNLLKALAAAPPVSAPAPRILNVPPRIALGGTIQAAKIVSRLQPVYPVLARQARREGTVLLHAIIDREGRVSELRMISGDPLLASAALEAVRQWRYQPTLLNGVPVEVETTITVTFVLGAR